MSAEEFDWLQCQVDELNREVGGGAFTVEDLLAQQDFEEPTAEDLANFAFDMAVLGPDPYPTEEQMIDDAPRHAA